MWRPTDHSRCLGPFERWDRGFESRSKHECLFEDSCVMLLWLAGGFGMGYPSPPFKAAENR
jgi:hypothetical protein